MGNGGLVGSPLARPYLHFAYNFVVVLPLVLAFWDQTKRLTESARPARPDEDIGARPLDPVAVAG
jgi:hypothetical protein